MTDDNARYRSSDPFAPTPDQGGHGNDPLAELARLIGQRDPFADLARREQQHAPPPRAPQPYDDPPPQDEHHSDRHADRYSGEQPAYDPQHRRDPSYDPRYDAPHPADPAPHFAEPAPRAHEPAPEPDWHRQPPFDPFAPASSRGGEPSHGDDPRDEVPPRPTSAPEFSFPPLHAQPARYSNSPSYDPPSSSPSSEAFAAPSQREPAGTPASPLPFASDRAASYQPSPPLDEYYDDAPQGRRKGMITVAAVFMLAVFGTAGAFGYRTWVGSSPSAKPAPAVIRASAEPAKVAPPAPAVDPNANKISYDRFADRGQNEKVVMREEKPVDIREATRTGSAMTAVPVPSQPAPSQPAPATAANGGTPSSVLTDPKKVRTVTIRPDAPDTSVARPPMVTQPAPVAPAPSNAPLDLANPASPPQQARASAARPTPPPPAVRPAPPAPTGANAPLSLAPENAPLPPPGTRAAAPTRVAAAPAGNGSYLVQVSSQRSEADAQAAFRSVKSKYSSVLGDRQPVIRRADLAGKGTYYRAMVGPFSTRDQAIQLCSSLKAAGGDCVVQAN